jgi:hypothetical protein
VTGTQVGQDSDRFLPMLKTNPTEQGELMSLLAKFPQERRAQCPRCGAATVQVISMQTKNLGAAVLAEWLLDSTAAGVAASSKTVVCNACVACGFQWLPGSLQDALARLVSGQFGSDVRQAAFNRWESLIQESDDERHRSARRLAWLGALAVTVAIALWAYFANWSPEARTRAAQFQRAEAWANCVVASKSSTVAECGPLPVPRDVLNDWLNGGHLDVWNNPRMQATLIGRASGRPRTAAPQPTMAKQESWTTCYLRAPVATEIAACSKKWLTTHSDSVWADRLYPGLRTAYLRSDSIRADSTRRARRP